MRNRHDVSRRESGDNRQKKKDDCSSAACRLENKDVRMGAERERLGAATMISADNEKEKHGFLSVSRQHLAACFFAMSRTTTEDSPFFNTGNDPQVYCSDLHTVMLSLWKRHYLSAYTQWLQQH